MPLITHGYVTSSNLHTWFIKRKRRKIGREHLFLDIARVVAVTTVPSRHSLLSSHSGPKLYKEPSAKSNKHIIQNALAHCCLAGKVNEGQKNKILEVTARSVSFIVIYTCRGRGVLNMHAHTTLWIQMLRETFLPLSISISILYLYKRKVYTSHKRCFTIKAPQWRKSF